MTAPRARIDILIWVTALKRMREAVLNSYTGWTSRTDALREAFALDSEASKESSFYEVDFVLADGVRWTYGFELGDVRVRRSGFTSIPRP